MLKGTLSALIDLTLDVAAAFGQTGARPAALPALRQAFAIEEPSGKLWAGTLTFAASTAQTLDFANLAWPDGTVVNFTGGAVKGIYALNRSGTDGQKVIATANISNGFVGPFGTTAEIRASSPLILPNMLATGWPIDSTHHLWSLDPGANAQTVDFVIWGK